MPRGLHRISDAEPGIHRSREGEGFVYEDQDGHRLPEPERGRVELLAVPPAWQDVWISPDPDSHIQATGVDAAGRKQYIYHETWRQQQDSLKFQRLEAFGEALPALREAVRADLHRPGLPYRKVVAAVVRLLERSFIRIGSERYLEHGSHGATTLEEDHVDHVSLRDVRLRFPGKGGKEHEVDVEDARVAAVVRECQELPGQRLFEYEDEEGVHAVDSGDVNAYLQDVMEGPFTSKDFRTWSASVLMLHHLQEAGPQDDEKARTAVVRDAVKEVAEELQHTPDICRKSYIHPFVPASYVDGSLEERIEDAPVLEGLWPEERRFQALLASYR